MDALVRAAVARSHLRDLPTAVLDELLRDARRARLPASLFLHHAGDPAPHLELVVAGVLRAFVTAPDGRTMTVRYCRAGNLIGVASLFADRFSMPATVQVLADAEILHLRSSVAQRCAATDTGVAQAFLGELADRVVCFIDEITDDSFATVRQRVSRHLLELAAQQRPAPGNELAVSVHQRELADAVGTAREVLVRVLRALRTEGVVRTERDRIVIVDPARLVSDWSPGS